MKSNSSAVEARIGCFTAFPAAIAAKILAYGRTPYTKCAKNLRLQTNLHSIFVTLYLAELLRKKDNHVAVWLS